MTRLETWVRQWFTVPPSLTGKERWGYGTYTVFVPLAWTTHVAFLFLFLYWQVLPLALFNAFSVLIWTVAFVTTKRLYLRLTFLMVYLEILAHAVLCFLFLGWDFGYQYQIIGIFVAPFLMPIRKRESLLTALVIAGVTIWARQYTMYHPPLAQIDAYELGIMSIVNMAAGFVLLIAGMFHFAGIAERAEANLEMEHRKSEALLNNVLPTAIATRLKGSTSIIADSFPEASVLFADIVGFTPLAQRIQPAELVSILDGVFSRFDELVDRFHLEKIRTIGDAYMVAAGIPLPRADHAESIANLALEMRTALAAYNRERGVPLQVRIGISSGAVVAGVIGRRRFLYDLWGDTVNTASRMESHSAPGGIQVSEDTANLLFGKFILVERGVTEIKGKGAMKTYWLEERLAAQEGAATPGLTSG